MARWVTFMRESPSRSAEGSEALLHKPFEAPFPQEIVPVAVITPVAEKKQKYQSIVREVRIDVLHGRILEAVSGDILVPAQFSAQIGKGRDLLELVQEISAIV